jgi:hypothetical protein
MDIFKRLIRGSCSDGSRIRLLLDQLALARRVLTGMAGQETATDRDVQQRT